jgi:hypothetical protein
MANFCLLSDYVNKFKQGIVSGEIDVDKLANMTSKERQTFLKKFVGESAKDVNAEFESKLLLKNQQTGMINWAKGVSGISKTTRQDIISRISRMDKVLDPENKQMFLSDLAERRLGVGVSDVEAKNIMDLSRKATQLETNKLPDGTFKSDADRLNYGRAVVDLSEYVNGLKVKAKEIKLQDIKSNPVGTVAKVAEKISGNLKSMKASLDVSYLGNQGRTALITHPGIWFKNTLQSFRNIYRQFGGANIKREVTADIVSRPNSVNGIYKKAGLAVGNLEEAFPETLVEKIPVAGKPFKVSDDAFTTFLQKTRADVFDKYLEMAQKSGVDITDVKQLKAIGKLANAQTGRGYLGKIEPIGNTINSVFFSPRKLAANIQLLAQPFTGAGGSNFVRKQAAISLLKNISLTAGVLGLSQMVSPDSVEWDPRSSDFGKIRIGNTRFDITGGMSSLITLMSRLATKESKSSNTGIVSKIDDKTNPYASTSGDLVMNFFSNKLSPAASIIKQLYTGKDFNGNPITPTGIGKDMFLPLGIQSYSEMVKDPNHPNLLLGMIADAVGFPSNTYMPKGDSGGASWEKSTAQDISQFKKKLGDAEFKKASQRFDEAYNSYIVTIRKNPEFKKLTDDEKKKLLSAQSKQLKQDIFDMYGFEPEYVDTDTEQSSLVKSLNEIKR